MFLPLAGALLLLFLALTLVALWNERRSEIDWVERDVDAAVRLFELQLASDVDTMQVAMEPMLEDPAILDRFVSGDREGLLALVRARFDALHRQHGISHMYFVGPDRVTFLRVHQPDNHGDVIERITMTEAQRTGRPTSGLELGVLGVPGLRVVSPIEHEGRIIGYLELGREIDQYAGDIRRILGIELHVLIRKDLVVEREWLKGQALLGREADWERFDEFVAAGAADDGEEFGEVLEEAVPQLSPSADEPVRVDLDGRHIGIDARPLRGLGGQQLGLLVVSLDVTRAVLGYRRALIVFLVACVAFTIAMVWVLHRIVQRVEERLLEAEAIETQAKAQLEQRVEERTAQLSEQIAEREKAESQLRQAQKMEVIGQLTGGVAHDFNNLLAIITSDLEAVRDRLAADGLEELIEGAWEATERGTALIARLLAVSRRQSLSPRAVDPNQLIEGLLPLLERAVPRRVEIKTQYGEDLWPCFVDPSQLENLILNLVVNARDALPDGGTLILATRNHRVSPAEALEMAIAPDDYVELTVTDTGTGMSREVLERAFDPFFTTKEIGRGSGLGLSMVQGTAKQSGGHVELESTLGVGTTVRLLLPRAGERRATTPEPMSA